MTRNLVGCESIAGFEALRQELLDESFLRGRPPIIDVYTDDGKALVLEAHLPNFSEKEIEVSVHRGALVIQAERHGKQEDETKRFVVRESNSFYRSIELPEQANVKQATAEFADGVLRVAVPLKAISPPTKIAIESSHPAD
ncbi:Hsp20/alpha crystallin family protein [Arthrobacter rhombi]|uniref:Hsp20/alpha crystallin family protein n=1 Tax=Arthrobacter rhombi TaxID=71253 RepID=UPI003FD07DA5